MSVLNLTFSLLADENTKTCNVPLSTNYMFYVVGDLGGGLLSLEASPDNGNNWFTVEAVGVPSRLIRYLVSGEKVRLKLEGSSNPNILTGIRQ